MAHELPVGGGENQDTDEAKQKLETEHEDILLSELLGAAGHARTVGLQQVAPLVRARAGRPRRSAHAAHEPAGGCA